MSKTTVLIVDDSALIRKVLTEILSSSKDIEVIGTAADPLIARDKIKKLNPDVITLDVEMPKMDGITFLKNLMRLRPMPVIMISTLTEAGADVTIQALELGAVDFISKPKMDVNAAIKDYSTEIIDKVLAASKVSTQVLAHRFEKSQHKISHTTQSTSLAKLSENNAFLKTTDKIIAIGSSTGGTEAVKEVLMGLPPNIAGIVISQHIPPVFSASFAQRLNELTQLSVVEAKDGDLIRPGCVFIAPGDRHLKVKRSGAKYYCVLDNGPEVNRHKPSVDVMFQSVSQNVGPNAMGIMLTGMGADGADGMLEMRQQGAYNISQDEESCVVWGMPGAAVKRGAVEKEFTLSKIAQEIVNYCCT